MNGPCRWGKLRALSGLGLDGFKVSLRIVKARDLAYHARERGESKYEINKNGLDFLEYYLTHKTKLPKM
jgi:hypothetical protein